MKASEIRELLERHPQDWQNTDTVQGYYRCLELLFPLVEALDKIANKETCNELYPGFEKYNNYQDGWEGVSTYSSKALTQLENKLK